MAMLNGHSGRYVEAAIAGELARLGSAEIGERNITLFKATAALASLGLREGQILHHLKPVAEKIGLRGRELYSTVKSGVRNGQANPRVPGATLRRVPEPAPPISTSAACWPPRTRPDGEGRRPAFLAAGDEGPRRSPDELRRHVYRDDAGRPVRVKVKRNSGFVNWYRVQDRDRDGWQAGKPDGYVPRPYVGAFDPFDRELTGDLLYWPEGEKDVDSLSVLGLPAFTFGGTGDGLPDAAVECTRGRELIILADNDRAGLEHAEKKARLAHGIAANIKVVGFPDLAGGGDVSDYLNVHTASDLLKLVESSPDWTPPIPAKPAARSLMACRLSDIAPEKVEWLWPGRVAIGKLTMIAGEPGLGKSQLAISVAAAVTTGSHWPDTDSKAPSGSVIVLSAEDGVADTIRPRFDAAGGDPSRVTIIRAVQNSERGAHGRSSFNLAGDLELLEQLIASLGDVRLILIDPVSSYLGKVDSYKNAEVRSVLEPLGEMAERLGVAILAVTHLSKGDGKAIHRFSGSIAFVAAARTAFAVVADPEDESGLRRLLLQVKNNIAPRQCGLAFRLAQSEVAAGVIGSAVAWDDTRPVELTVDQALNGQAREDDSSAKSDAETFLREVLASGPMDVLDIETEARAAAMLSESKRLKESKPFRAAAQALGVIKQRHGFGPGARHQWSLPGSAYASDGEGRDTP